MVLLKYLPPFVQEYKEIEEILQNGEQVEFDSLWSGISNIRENQFILSSTEYGVQRWEKMLLIQPMSDDTLDERKFRILAVLNAQLPYTLKRLNEMLATMCGANGFKTILYNDTYNLIVKLAISNEKNYSSVLDLLKVICPANLTLNVYMFNTHAILHRLTHGEMKPYTQYELRTEIL